MRQKPRSKPKVSYWTYVKPHFWWMIAGPLVVALDGVLEEGVFQLLGVHGLSFEKNGR